MRTNVDERRVVAYAFLTTCGGGFPEDPHVALDVLRRDLGILPEKAIEIAAGARSLGIVSKVDKEDSLDCLHVRWDIEVDFDDPETKDMADERSMEIAIGMFAACIEHLCPACIDKMIENLDFSTLGQDL